MPAALEETADSLTSLEERIHRAVELVAALRKEKQALVEQLEVAFIEKKTALEQAAEAQAHSKRLERELEETRMERKHVRTRIEKLLGQMDLLSAS